MSIVKESTCWYFTKCSDFQSRGVLPWNLGRGVQSGTLNLDPNSDPTMSFSTPVLRLALKNPGLFSDLKLLWLGRQQKDFLKSFSNSHIFFFVIHLELKQQKVPYAAVVRDTRFQTKVYTRFQTETGQKPYPPLGRHILQYTAHIREYHSAFHHK